jgi:regulatory protein
MRAMSRDKRQQTAHDYALVLLSQRAYTRAALARKLAARGFDNDDVEREIEALEKSQLIDDEKFADAYCRTQLTTRRKSIRRVTLELIRKGIAPDRARAAIAAVMDEGSVDIDDSLRRLAEKKSASLASLDNKTRRRRLMSYLVRQGFEVAAVRRVLDEALN